MPDYSKIVIAQFRLSDINFQRLRMVDTSNPFIARWMPAPDVSIAVSRFRDPHGVDIPDLLPMIHNIFMSRTNLIVVPRGTLDMPMQLILPPMILKLVERRRWAI